MKRILLSTLAVSSLFLTACTNTPEECDPRQDLNLFSKISCSVSGSYEQRIDQKEQDLAYEQNRASSAQAEANRTLKQSKAMDKKVQQAKAAKQQSAQATAALQQQVNQKTQTKQQAQAELNKVNQQINKIQNSGSADAQQAELERLQKRAETLRQAVNSL